MRSDIRVKRTFRRRPSAARSPAQPSRYPSSLPPGLPDEMFIGPTESLRTSIPRALVRRVAVAAIALLVLTGVGVRAEETTGALKADVTDNIRVAAASLEQGKESLGRGQYDSAAQQFRLGREALHRANQSLAGYGQLGTVTTAVSGNLTTGRQLLSSAELLAASGEDLAGDLAAVRADLGRRQNNYYQAGEAIVPRLPELQRHLQTLNDRLDLLEYSVGDRQRVGLTGEVRVVADQLAEILPPAKQSVQRAEEVVAVLPGLLGTEQFKTYLVWFQNPAELRPTGGFIGTYGRLTFDGGVLKEQVVDSIYNPANQVNTQITETGPAPYARFLGHSQAPPWSLQNTNWSPDLPTSARKFQQYYEQSGGPTTDGVISLTTKPVIDILRVAGPVELPEHGYTLTADNFADTIQTDQYAKGVAGEADPKRILRDFVPKLLAKIGQLPPTEQQNVYEVLAAAAAHRDLQLYFRDEQADALATAMGADGRMKLQPGAWSVIDTNIDGRKSSTTMQVAAENRLAVDDDGQVRGKVSVSRRQDATGTDPNRNWTRVFLPKGSHIVRSGGWSETGSVTIDEQDGFTVVGGWTDVSPGGERTISVEYELPEELPLGEGVFPVHYRKQPGTEIEVATILELPAGYQWRHGDGGSIETRTVRFQEPASTDLSHTPTFGKGDS